MVAQVKCVGVEFEVRPGVGSLNMSLPDIEADMTSSTSISKQLWPSGHNMPSLGHDGGNTTLNVVGFQLLGNIQSNLAKLPQQLLHQIACTLAGRQVRKDVHVDGVLPMLRGVARSTLQSWSAKIDTMKSSADGGSRS